MLVETMYNRVALNCGFPLYIDEVSTPDTTRFLLEMLSRALINTIDNIYISQNVLEKRDQIITKPGQDHYATDGMVKSIQYEQNQGKLSGKIIPFNYYIDNPGMIMPVDKVGPPLSYVVDKGEVRFFPTPDQEYKIRITTSTTDLVWANDDSSRNSIEDIRDSVMSSKDFCDIIILRACAYVLGRCLNQNAQFYSKLADDRLKKFLERDSNSLEKPRFNNPVRGHYSPRSGLLNSNDPPGGFGYGSPYNGCTGYPYGRYF